MSLKNLLAKIADISTIEEPEIYIPIDCRARVEIWLHEVVYPKYWIANPNGNKRDYPAPYQGASGGGVTYSFTPTAIGVACIVTNCWTDDKLDLTNYDAW